MKNRTVLITGSSKGLGESLAIIFAKNNYDIILHGRNKERLEMIKEKIIEGNGGSYCYIIEGDIKSDETIKKLSEKAIQEDISILINNAAVSTAKRLEDLTIREMEDNLATNLIAPIKLTKAIYPLFLNKKSGTIININSIDGKNAKPLLTEYCASKFGLKGFTDSLRFEAKDNNIRVIGVHLGGMQTEMYTGGKENFEKCMNPSEVAQLIYDLSKTYPTSGVDEVVINRQKYK